MENGQQEGMMPKEEKTEETVQEVPFEEQLDAAVEQNKDQFYQNVLKQADERIKALNEQVEEIQKQQLEFRDEVAVRCFVPLIPVTDDYKKAASDAYRAADAFLRVRESGDEIIS